MKSRLIPEAEDDLDEAVAWYDRKDTKLGDDFLRCVDKCIQSIELRPELYPKIYRRMRRALVETFPYQVLYEADPTEVVIYAVFHCARNPRIWKKRVHS